MEKILLLDLVANLRCRVFLAANHFHHWEVCFVRKTTIARASGSPRRTREVAENTYAQVYEPTVTVLKQMQSGILTDK
jgi:hypothetical protein